MEVLMLQPIINKRTHFSVCVTEASVNMCSWHGLLWSGMRVCECVLLPAGRWCSQACTALKPCQYDGWFGLDGGRTRTSLAPLLWDVLKTARQCVCVRESLCV